jgi:hypothetical protein
MVLLFVKFEKPPSLGVRTAVFVAYLFRLNWHLAYTIILQISFVNSTGSLIGNPSINSA